MLASITDQGSTILASSISQGSRRVPMTRAHHGNTSVSIMKTLWWNGSGEGRAWAMNGLYAFILEKQSKLIFLFHPSSDIVSATMSTKPITFTRSQDGWFFKEDKIV